MQKISILLSAICLLSMTSCSTVQTALHDYQKKHAYAMDYHAKESASTSAVKERDTKKALTDNAKKYIGSKYRYGSCDASKGFDCSGLVYHVAKSQSIALPRSSSSMAAAGTQIPWKKAEPGDLIFFGESGRINHVGIVEKNKGDELWIIHSSSSLGVVRENILVSDYWKKRVRFAMDIISKQGA